MAYSDPVHGPKTNLRAGVDIPNRQPKKEIQMFKKALLATLAAGLTLASVSAADAAGGCGPGFHRGPYDGCRPNRGPVLVGAPGIGIFYPGRGYWDGHRYWANRYAWHGGWRYR
jgi:hypothetical protein